MAVFLLQNKKYKTQTHFTSNKKLSYDCIDVVVFLASVMNILLMFA